MRSRLATLRRQEAEIGAIPVPFDAEADRIIAIAASLRLAVGGDPVWRQDPTYNLKR